LKQSQGRQPQRTCIACRKVADQADLVRYVLAPDQRVVVDYRHKLPGRGAYTCLSAECLSTAVARQAFQRCFRGKADLPDAADLLVQLVNQIELRIESLLGMARKSGQVESGTSAALGRIRGRKPSGVLMVSDDISEGIAEKLRAAALTHNVPAYTLFDKSRIGRLLGKGERSAVVVTAGALADTMKDELERLALVVREN